MNYRIQLTQGRFLWRARVVAVVGGIPEVAPRFYGWSREQALSRAEAWCNQDHRNRFGDEELQYTPELIA